MHFINFYSLHANNVRLTGMRVFVLTNQDIIIVGWELAKQKTNFNFSFLPFLYELTDFKNKICIISADKLHE